MGQQKPPLGLKPRNLFLEERAYEITEAIQRYFEAGQEVPVNWIEEYNVIRCELNGSGFKWLEKNLPPFVAHPNT
ncbi:MAG: hypothetical protein RR603_02500 [Kurthia sp.]